jgi:hypothetical protein
VINGILISLDENKNLMALRIYFKIMSKELRVTHIQSTHHFLLLELEAFAKFDGT